MPYSATRKTQGLDSFVHDFLREFADEDRCYKGLINSNLNV